MYATQETALPCGAKGTKISGMDAKEFSRLVSRAMAARKLTDKAVALACGVSDQAVSNWRKGKIKVAPRGRNAAAVAAYLGFRLPGESVVGELTDAEELLLLRIREIGPKAAGKLLWPETVPPPPGKPLDCEPVAVADYSRLGQDHHEGQPVRPEADDAKPRRRGR